MRGDGGMTKVCKRHADNPVIIYHQCVGCELEWLHEELERKQQEIEQLKQLEQQYSEFIKSWNEFVERWSKFQKDWEGYFSQGRAKGEGDEFK